MTAGWDGQSEPEYTDLTIVGETRYKGCTMGYSSSPSHYFGQVAFTKRGVLKYVNDPVVKNGVVQDWHRMELLWKHVFELGLNTHTDEFFVMLSEPFDNPKESREHTAQVFFEKFGVPSYSAEPSASLALYASGRVSGCTLDVGYQSTRCLGIVDGDILDGAAKRLDLGGQSLTDRMFKCMSEEDMSKEVMSWFNGCYGRNIIRDTIREMRLKLAYVALDFDAEMKRFAAMSAKHHAENQYELPDGNVVPVGVSRFTCPEALFRPSLVGLNDANGVDKMILRTVTNCDVFLQTTLYENVVCAGGTTLTKNFPERLERSLIGDSSLMAHVMTSSMLLRFLSRRGILPSSMSVLRGEYESYVRPRESTKRHGVVALTNREHATWIGGSILAQGCSQIGITKEQYEEFGPSIVHRVRS